MTFRKHLPILLLLLFSVSFMVYAQSDEPPPPEPYTVTVEGRELTFLPYGSRVEGSTLAVNEPFCPDAPPGEIFFFEGAEGDVVNIEMRWQVWARGQFTPVSGFFYVVDIETEQTLASSGMVFSLSPRIEYLHNFVVPYDGVFGILVATVDGEGCLDYNLSIYQVIDLYANYRGPFEDAEFVVHHFNGVPMVLVPPGCFRLGSDDLRSSLNGHEVCFDEPFWIDQYEVTVGQFEIFGGIAEQTASYTNPLQPRDRINWYEARDFCELRGGRLPTEVEWEYAARGPDNLIYPWGNEFVPVALVWADPNPDPTVESQLSALSDLITGRGDRMEAQPVGSRPGGVSWVGAYDMSGNLSEWTSTLESDYPYDPTDGRENLNTEGRRVIRGGYFSARLPTTFMTATRNMGLSDNSRQTYIGIRCARDFTGMPEDAEIGELPWALTLPDTTEPLPTTQEQPAQPGLFDAINTLLDEARRALDADDLPTARALILAARVLITDDMVAACSELEEARDMLNEASRPDVTSAAAVSIFLTAARSQIDLCGSGPSDMADSDARGPAEPAQAQAGEEPLYVLAFYSDTDGNLETDDDREIIVILSDGQHISQTSSPVYSDFPLQWVSNTELLLSSTRDGGLYHLFIWNVATGTVQQVTHGDEHYYDAHLTLDGSTAVFVRYPDPDTASEIYTISLGGSDLNRLTDNNAEDQVPIWSPDGRSIVFMSNRSGSWNVFTMDASGGSVRNLTNDSSNNRFPVWSPDGRRIAFSSNRGGTYNIYIMDANGANLQQLTFHETSASRPAWSPDGRYIFYNLQIDAATYDIYRVDVASGETQAVFEGPGSQFAVRVGPEPVTEWTMP